MYAEIAVATLVIVSVTATKFAKDLLIVRLIRTLAREGSLTSRQRSEICAHLASALRPSDEGLEREPSGGQWCLRPQRQKQLQVTLRRLGSRDLGRF
jgi:hypothetical protein